MRLLSYTFKDIDDDGWCFPTIQLRLVNLFVGATGSGKSRLLNSLINVASFIHKNSAFKAGDWVIVFSVGEIKYQWKFESRQSGDLNEVIFDQLCVVGADGNTNVLYERTPNDFIFNNQKLPKLPRDSTGIFLLKDEDAIAPVHAAFAKIFRRSFFGSDLQDACSITNLPRGVTEKKKTKLDVHDESVWHLPVGAKLYLLREKNKDKFLSLVDQYKAVFPSIEHVDFTDGTKILNIQSHGLVPVLTVKEKGVARPVMLHELSSGMQKVLLILTDVILMEKGSVYVIDEYENSLGINAINFLPGFLSDFGGESQFIITSHHPYLINHMPVANWHVFHRTGSKVAIESGEVLVSKYGMSKQEAFIQLINDPLYTGGSA